MLTYGKKKNHTIVIIVQFKKNIYIYINYIFSYPEKEEGKKNLGSWSAAYIFLCRDPCERPMSGAKISSVLQDLW